MDKVWLVTGSASGLGRIAGNSRFLPLAAEKAGVRFGAGAAKRADGKSVPKIVQPRSLAIVWPAQANLPRQIVKRSAHFGIFQAAAAVIEKEAGRRWTAQKPVAAPGVIGHDIPSGRTERNQAAAPAGSNWGDVRTAGTVATPSGPLTPSATAPRAR